MDMNMNTLGLAYNTNPKCVIFHIRRVGSALLVFTVSGNAKASNGENGQYVQIHTLSFYEIFANVVNPEATINTLFTYVQTNYHLNCRSGTCIVRKRFHNQPTGIHKYAGRLQPISF